MREHSVTYAATAPVLSTTADGIGAACQARASTANESQDTADVDAEQELTAHQQSMTVIGAASAHRHFLADTLVSESNGDETDYDSPSKDPFSRKYYNRCIQNTDQGTPTPRDVLYSFLLSVRVSQLRGRYGPLKKHGISQQLSKQAMASALLHVASKTVAEGGGSVNYDDGIVFTRGEATKWLDNCSKSSALLRIAPTDIVLELYSPVSSSGGSRKKGETGISTAALTVNEFARLVALLMTDESIRAALLKYGLDLTRSELDKRAGRDEFRVSFVEPKINDRSIKVSLPGRKMPPCLETVVPNTAVSQFRSGDFLKRKFFESRTSFTQWRLNWSVSGNYEVDSFDRFVAQPPLGGTAFPTMSLFAIILFHATRCGEKDAVDTEMLEWVAKTGEGDCKYDDMGADEPGFTGSRARKRKRPSESPSEATAMFLPALQQVSRSIASFVSGDVSTTKANGARLAAETEAARAGHMSSIISVARSLSADLRQARLQDEDPEIIPIMEDQLADVLLSVKRLRAGRME